ncbi:location of vulva defective 1-like [Scylla paramamosain]|uniref:location of vulva defective 1-like n=1 Tax=Scylla paramamosain TaxID=85552 RepID=UPI003082FEB0
MKNTPAFLLLLLLVLPLLLLLPQERCHTRALALQCPHSFQTVGNGYFYITNASTTEGEQINTTMYVRPQQGLKVLLGVEGSAKYYAWFFLEKDCFKGDRQWWDELWVKVKRMGTNTFFNQVLTTYKLQVRTSTCIKSCTREVYMQGVDSLHVLASSASQWRLDHPGTHCGHIYQRMRGNDRWPFPTCTDVNPSSLVTTHVKFTTTPNKPRTSTKPTTITNPTTTPTNPTTPIKPTTTPTKPTTTPIKPTTIHAMSTTPTKLTTITTTATLITTPATPTTTSATPTAAQVIGIIGGVVGGIVVVAVIMVRKQRDETATEDVAMHP